MTRKFTTATGARRMLREFEADEPPTLPWSFDEGGDDFVITAPQDCEDIATVTRNEGADTNVRHLVRAANAHEALVRTVLRQRKQLAWLVFAALEPEGATEGSVAQALKLDRVAVRKLADEGRVADERMRAKRVARAKAVDCAPRLTPPTDAELDAVQARGDGWRITFAENTPYGMADTWVDFTARAWRDRTAETSDVLTWQVVDAGGIERPWPVVKP